MKRHFRTRCNVLLLLTTVVFIVAIAGLGSAQSRLDELHVVPRSTPTPGKSKVADFSKNVDLVLVPVTVLDHNDRVVSGLQAGNFAVIDNKIPQTIKYFSQEDAPISLTVILDASGSMGNKLDEARAAALRLFESSNQRDELTLVTFGDSLHVAGNPGESLDEIREAIRAVTADGYTALWDAMYFGARTMHNAYYQRRAIVVITDGGDNRSRYTESEIKSLLLEADVQVYAIGIFDRFARTFEEKIGPLRLDEVTSVTGGRVLSAHDAPELLRAVVQINEELRNQYVLGYSPSSPQRDGKWRHLKVQLSPATDSRKFLLHAKKGYYGPLN
jgi:Ca-activated chloride channel family protein